MAPTVSQALAAPFRIGVVQLAADAESSHGLLRRDLSNPNHTQQVTLGVIGAYVVIIAILWNVPYIRMVLWPFKVCMPLFVVMCDTLGEGTNR